MVNVAVNFDKKKNFNEKLILYWGNTCIHVHHWIFFGLFAGLLYFGRYANDTLFNVAIMLILGAIAEDFLWRNVFNLRTPCDQVNNP